MSVFELHRFGHRERGAVLGWLAYNKHWHWISGALFFGVLETLDELLNFPLDLP